MKFSNRIEKMMSSPIRRLSPYVDAAKERGLHVIPLNIGQPDVETPEEFFEAVRNFDNKVLAYADSRGYMPALQAQQAYYKGHGLDYEIEDLLITNGASEAITFSLTAIMDQGDECLTVEPYYPNYEGFVHSVGGVLVGVRSFVEDGFAMPSIEAFEEKITDKTRCIMLSNPGNPNGRVYDKDEIDRVVEVAKKHQLFIIADEVYREFNFTERDFHSFADYEEISQQVILLDSISKKYSACGARVGSIASKNKEFMAHILKLAQARLSVATLDQVGAGALIDASPDYLVDAADTYRKRRDFLADRLAQIPGITYSEPEGAFYIMVALPVEDAEQFIIWMLENVSVEGATLNATPAGGFYTADGVGDNEIRLSYVVNEDQLSLAMDILEKALEEYPLAAPAK